MSLSRFKASLVGAVMGDCIGGVYEGATRVKMEDVLQTVTKLEANRQEQREHGSKKASKYGLRYTDDTAMTRSVAASLIGKQGFDAVDMARRFSEEYFREPDRGYGSNIGSVFEALRQPALADVYKPASEQFDGSGSYGNGGAMRIAPCALFAYADHSTDQLQAFVTSITRLTHTNPLAINGAILQALAVDQCLRLPCGEVVDTDHFLDSLISKMKPLEESVCCSPPAKKDPARKLDAHPTPYTAKLEKMKELVKKEDLKKQEIVDVLGNNVSAVGSVPAAVLVFLRASTRLVHPAVAERNQFEQTILYAIYLGGDTDTIATMAAAMAGAFYGMDQVPEAWQYYCEGVDQAETDAEVFFKKLKR